MEDTHDSKLPVGNEWMELQSVNEERETPAMTLQTKRVSSEQKIATSQET